MTLFAKQLIVGVDVDVAVVVDVDTVDDVDQTLWPKEHPAVDDPRHATLANDSQLSSWIECRPLVSFTRLRTLATEATDCPKRVARAAIADAPRSRRDPHAADLGEPKSHVRSGQKACLHLQSIDSTKPHTRKGKRMSRSQPFTEAKRQRSYDGPTMRRVQPQCRPQ